MIKLLVRKSSKSLATKLVALSETIVTVNPTYLKMEHKVVIAADASSRLRTKSSRHKLCLCPTPLQKISHLNCFMHKAFMSKMNDSYA